MKLILFLINIIFLFTLTGTNVINDKNTTNSDDECQIYYSIIGKNDGRCSEDSTYMGSYSFATLKNGHIIEMYEILSNLL